MNKKVEKIKKEFDKRLAEDRRSRNRLRRLFPSGPTLKYEYSGAPEEGQGMKSLLSDMNEFNEHHANFLRSLGTKHT